MTTNEKIAAFYRHFGQIYLGGIPSLLNDDGAYLSFICVLTATEALGSLLMPDTKTNKNAVRFKAFVSRYYPPPLNTQEEELWKLRNDAVHGFLTGAYKLVHHKSYLHLKTDDGLTVLNAEDFYAALVTATKAYFDELQRSDGLRASFETRTSQGMLVVDRLKGAP